MTLSTGDLLAWLPHNLAAAADALAGTGASLRALQDELDDASVIGLWTGSAGASAEADRLRLVHAMNDLVASMACVVRGLDVAAEGAAHARRVLVEAMEWARAEGFAVDLAGAVLDVRPPSPDPHAVADRLRRHHEISDHVEQALVAARHTDEELAGLLGVVALGLVDGGSGRLSGAATLGTREGERTLLTPPVGGRVGDWNAWWWGLTDGEQRRIIALHPEWIGNTDGIPARARHLANLRLLARWGTPTAGLRALQRLLAAHPDERQLLALDTTGRDLRVVLGVGDLDRARHVLVVTPGFGTTVAGDLDAWDDRLVDLLARSRALDGGPASDHAAVLWLGHAPPQLDDTLVPGRTVLRDDAARSAADDLAGFLDGVDGSRADDPHLGVAGHSYGSLVTGLALRHSTGVDEGAFLGSPGTGTDDLGDLDLPRGHAFHLEASGDLIGDAGLFGRDPSFLEDMRHLSTEASAEWGTSGGRGHSSYFDDGSTSQHNLAAIASGHPEALVDDTGPPSLPDLTREGLWRLGELDARLEDLLARHVPAWP
ncbi:MULTISPECIES: alpha/beta hydrolase [unclassified Nocardioides]|uniref:alpha/beta hydrolase n=1 Tax=unclassified Nocardioides TaxID=2615069 RepID=UPI0006F2A4EC|nr:MULTISPECIES: alpha/beta hydrolase [unclassified Nocardioides]KQY55513.1 hypothetical protein ASD30_16580 [Nocardioides sp. Root140]KRF12750.1 hypothetical protein ASH02_14545 [Nocardioides sp. Soil796]